MGVDDFPDFAVAVGDFNGDGKPDAREEQIGVVLEQVWFASLVGWGGDWEGGWHGRKRGAASAAFDNDGVCVAHSRSFWVSVS